MDRRAEKPITVERLERAVKFAATLVVRYGDRYLPVLDAGLVHLENARRREPYLEQARRSTA